MGEISITTTKKGLKCERCGEVWFPRIASPKECPNCKSRDWNKQKE